MKEEFILSIDLGTSNLKAAVFDLNGNEIANASIECSLITPKNGIIENNVNLYWSNLIKIIKEITSQLGEKAKNISVLITSSQVETIVPI